MSVGNKISQVNAATADSNLSAKATKVTMSSTDNEERYALTALIVEFHHN